MINKKQVKQKIAELMANNKKPHKTNEANKIIDEAYASLLCEAEKEIKKYYIPKSTIEFLVNENSGDDCGNKEFFEDIERLLI